jgi:large subunit ribosomal protein L35
LESLWTQRNNFELFFCALRAGVTFALHFSTHINLVMPKMKTHSSAKKRFSVTGTGKVKRNRARRRHIASTKTKKQKRHLRGSVIVDRSEHARIERLLVI